MTQRKYYEPGVWVDTQKWPACILDIGLNRAPANSQIYGCKVFFMDKNFLIQNSFGGDPKDIMIAPKELVAWQD